MGEGETSEVPVREEQVMVEKQPVVKEEMGLAMRQVQETQQVKDTVGQEQARLEREGHVNVQGSDVDEVTHQPEPESQKGVQEREV
jgi:stress response protein YsnF